MFPHHGTDHEVVIRTRRPDEEETADASKNNKDTCTWRLERPDASQCLTRWGMRTGHDDQHRGGDNEAILAGLILGAGIDDWGWGFHLVVLTRQTKRVAICGEEKKQKPRGEARRAEMQLALSPHSSLALPVSMVVNRGPNHRSGDVVSTAGVLHRPRKMSDLRLVRCEGARGSLLYLKCPFTAVC